MTRLIVICEGETEREFCRDVLAPYFFSRNIVVQHPMIKLSRGGIVNWTSFKRDVELHLKSDPGAHVTTFIDLYGLRKKHAFPGFRPVGVGTSVERVTALEQGMAGDLDAAVRYRFHPYIQLHEFEALLFADAGAIHDNFADVIKDPGALDRIAEQYPNPEDINDNPMTAPSKRLERIIPGYQKVLYGTLLAQEIGMDKLLERCPRFRRWVEDLLALTGK